MEVVSESRNLPDVSMAVVPRRVYAGYFGCLPNTEKVAVSGLRGKDYER